MPDIKNFELYINNLEVFYKRYTLNLIDIVNDSKIIIASDNEDTLIDFMNVAIESDSDYFNSRIRITFE